MTEVIDAGQPAGEVAPVVNEAPVTPAPEVKEGVEAVKEGEEAAPNPDDPSAQPKKEKGVGKRINELVRQREDERREKEYWRELALKTQGITPKQDQKEVAQGKPEASKFESYEAYIEALTDWKYEQRQKADRERTEKESSATQTRQRQLEALTGFEDRADKAREKYEDFDDVAFSQFPVTESMTEAILASESGPEILYYLGNNPKEAARIARLPPFVAAREIGKLEAKLPELTKQSSAPAPITPVKPKSNASEAPSEADDMKSWIAKRNKQLGR